MNGGPACRPGVVGRIRCAAPQLATLVVLALGLGLAVWLGGPADAPAEGPAEPHLFGVALGLHPEAGVEYPPALPPVLDLGAQAVLLPVDVWQDDLRSSRVERGAGTPSMEDLAALVRRAHRLGLATALMPVLNLREGAPEDWRGRIVPAAPDRWWASYRALVLEYARLAEGEGVAVLVIGSELSSIQGDAAQWASLAAAVRAQYGGRIGYVANFDALDTLAPFPHVDLAGVSAYFPIAEDVDSPRAALVDGWRGVAARLEEFRRQVERSVVVFEVGYPSLDGAAVWPWDHTRGAPIDLEEQASAYHAATEALLELRPEGVFFWTWFGPGGPHDRHYTPRGKPAEAVLRRYLTRVRAGG